MHPRITRCTVLFGIIAIVLAVPAQGANLLPMSIGSNWEYTGDQDGSWMLEVTGTAEVIGTTTKAFRYVINHIGGDEDFYYYNTSDVDGNVYLNGLYSPGDAAEVAFDPPVLWLPSDPYVGMNYSTETLAYDNLAGEGDGSPVTYTFEVSEEIPVLIPDDEVTAFGIVALAPLPTGTGAALPAAPWLSGARIGADAWRTEDTPFGWFANGKGMVQAFGYGELWQLTGYTVSAQSTTTWTDVKRLFR